MNYIDIILIIPLLWGAWKGFSKGLIIEVSSLAALVLGVWGGIHFSDFAAGLLTENFSFDERYLPIVSFALTFLVIVIAVYAIGKIVEKFVDVVALGFVNKLAGGAFGLAKVGLILSIILVIINSYDERLHFIPQDLKDDSLLYQPMTSTALTVVPALENSKLYEEMTPTMDSVDVTATGFPTP